MKIAPIIRAIEKKKALGALIHYRLVHTGQHFDRNMSEVFFEELGIPDPHANLGAGGGTQAEQTAAIMIGFERELLEYPADLVLVVGDVTSTLACSIVAKKMCIRVAHVEAGIRSGDMSMPEEVNRIVTDSITDFYFTTSQQANNNLLQIGCPSDRVFFVGNTMIDSLLHSMPKLKSPSWWSDKELKQGQFLLITLHRPSNVDDGGKLEELLQAIVSNSKGLPIIFPVHPRTRKKLKETKIIAPNLHFVEPMGYLEFIWVVKNSKAVITDSGGITEETTVLGVPCMTLRSSTERPETITMGTNELLGSDPSAIGSAMRKLHEGNWKKGTVPPFWDGKTADRIVSHLLAIHESKRSAVYRATQSAS